MNSAVMLTVGAMVGAPVEIKVRGRWVRATESARVAQQLDSARAHGVPYEVAVANAARHIGIAADLVRFHWVGWNTGTDSF
jgi:hypothetical protein